jgi:hypothetical protein
MIHEEIIILNKKISRMRYELNEYEAPEIQEMIDILQYHLFLVSKSLSEFELDSVDVKRMLLKKLQKE